MAIFYFQLSVQKDLFIVDLLNLTKFRRMRKFRQLDECLLDGSLLLIRLCNLTGRSESQEAKKRERKKKTERKLVRKKEEGREGVNHYSRSKVFRVFLLIDRLSLGIIKVLLPFR